MLVYNVYKFELITYWLKLREIAFEIFECSLYEIYLALDLNLSWRSLWATASIIIGIAIFVLPHDMLTWVAPKLKSYWHVVNVPVLELDVLSVLLGYVQS